MDHCNLFLPFISNKGRVAFPLRFSKKRKKKMHSRKLAKGEPKTEWDSEFFWEFEIFSKAFQKQ